MPRRGSPSPRDYYRDYSRSGSRTPRRGPGSVASHSSYDSEDEDGPTLFGSILRTLMAGSAVVAIAIFLVLRTFLIEAFRIPSGSMERTLLIGDFLFVNKALYGAEIPLTGVRLPALREPRRNDLVIFKSVDGGVPTPSGPSPSHLLKKSVRPG